MKDELSVEMLIAANELKRINESHRRNRWGIISYQWLELMGTAHTDQKRSRVLSAFEKLRCTAEYQQVLRESGVAIAIKNQDEIRRAAIVFAEWYGRECLRQYQPFSESPTGQFFDEFL